MQQAVAREPHSQRLMKVEVIDAEQLDAVLDFRQDAALDPHALRRDIVSRDQAPEPVGDQGDAEREYRGDPLPCAIE